MAGYIKLTAIGNLGSDPEMRYTPTGKAFTSFSLAVNTSYSRDGEKHESTEWLRCTCWGQLAELAAQYLSKGKKALIDGSLSTRSWEGADGSKRYSVEVNVQNLQFLSPRDGEGGGNGRQQQHDNRAMDVDPADLDSIPF